MKKLGYLNIVAPLLSLSSLIVFLAGPAFAESIETKVTEIDGNVFKREIIDLVSRGLGRTTPLKLEDALVENTQVGTGPGSRCELSWPSIKARLGGDTVLQIQPDKRIVYLAKGEVLIRQQKDSAGKLTIWSPVLRATLLGTTVIMQQTPTVTRFTVLEGSVELRNLVDEGVLILRPGVVYEYISPFEKPYVSDAPKNSKDEAIRQFWLPFDPFWEKKPPEHPVEGDFNWTLEGKRLDEPSPNVFNENMAPLELFQTPRSLSRIWILDCGRINLHPLLSKFKEPIDSASMIQNEFIQLPTICHPSTHPSVDNAMKLRNNLLGKSVMVTLGPSKVKFKVGKELGYQYSMPHAPSVPDTTTSDKSKTPPKKPPLAPPKKNYTVAQMRAFAKRLQRAYLLKMKAAETQKKQSEIQYNAMLEQLNGEAQQGLSPSVLEARKAKIEEWKSRQSPEYDKIVEDADKFKFHYEYWKQQIELKGEKL